MLKLSRIQLNRTAVLVLAVGAILFASGVALAEDPHTPDPHAADAHAADAHGDDAHADPHAADAHAEGEHHSSTPHLKNFVTLISPYLPAPVAKFLEDFVDPFFAYIVIILVCLFFIGVSRNLKATNPGRAQMAAETLVGGLYNMFLAIIGPDARRFTPFLGGLFIFIWFNNLFGMVPMGHAATSAFNTTTFALGLMTFIFVQGWALKLNGLGGYLHHMAGSPKTGMDWGFSILLFPLHLLGELVKPISLGLRLFGNIFGEDTLVATMVILGYIITKLIFGDGGFVAFLPGVPLQLPFYFLGLLSSTIQALVFTLLATVYIALWVPHGDHDDHGEAHGH